MEAKPFDLAVRNQARRALEERFGAPVGAWIALDENGLTLGSTEEALTLLGMEAMAVLGQSSTSLFGVSLREGILIETLQGPREVISVALGDYLIIGFVDPVPSDVIFLADEAYEETKIEPTSRLDEDFVAKVLTLASDLSYCQDLDAAIPVLDSHLPQILLGRRGFVAVASGSAAFGVVCQWPLISPPLSRPRFASDSLARMASGLVVAGVPGTSLPFLLAPAALCVWQGKVVVGIEGDIPPSQLRLLVSLVAGHLPLA